MQDQAGGPPCLCLPAAARVNRGLTLYLYLYPAGALRGLRMLTVSGRTWAKRLTGCDVGSNCNMPEMPAGQHSLRLEHGTREHISCISRCAPDRSITVYKDKAGTPQQARAVFRTLVHLVLATHPGPGTGLTAEATSRVAGINPLAPVGVHSSSSQGLSGCGRVNPGGGCVD